MADWGASGRRDTYRATLVDPNTLQDVEPLDIVPSGSSISYGYYTDNRYQGDITTLKPQENAASKLVRIYHKVEAGGTSIEQPMATMFVDANKLTAKYGVEESKLSCYSTMYRFTQDALLSDLNAKAGTSILGHIRKLVEDRHGILVVGEGVADRSLQQDHVVEIGTKVSTALSDMAGWINAQVGVDAMGHITIDPYVAPGDKDPAYSFTSRNSTYLPGISLDDGRGKVCNASLAYYTIEGSSGRHVEFLPQSNPYSKESIGRTVPVITKMTDRAYTGEELRQIAKQKLDENSGAIRYLEIEHVSIPGLRPGDVVLYENDNDFASMLSVRAMVTEMQIKGLKPGCICRTKLKVVE